MKKTMALIGLGLAFTATPAFAEATAESPLKSEAIQMKDSAVDAAHQAVEDAKDAGKTLKKKYHEMTTETENSVEKEKHHKMDDMDHMDHDMKHMHD